MNSWKNSKLILTHFHLNTDVPFLSSKHISNMLFLHQSIISQGAKKFSFINVIHQLTISWLIFKYFAFAE